MNDGGAAFPREDYQGDDAPGQRGMSLRDYFAAQFMARAQSLSEDRNGGWNLETAAACAYEMADAMLKARRP